MILSFLFNFSELFPQLNIINSELFPSKHAFGLRYCDAQQKRLIRNGKPIVLWDYNGAKNLDELKIILENTIMIRRLKKDVLNELPSKKREMVIYFNLIILFEINFCFRFV